MTQLIDKPFGTPRPLDTTPAVDPVISPCPDCRQPTITRLASDLGALYQCNNCTWELFMAWVDLEQPPGARPANHCEHSRTGGSRSMPVKLPTEPRRRTGDPMTARVLLVGHPKVGKTTTAANWAPKTTLILDTHAGTKLLDGEHYTVDIKSFTDFEQAVQLLTTTQHQYKTVVVDTIDDIYKFADRHAAENNGKVAAGLVEFGKGTAEAEARFREQLSALLASPLGLWFIGHADTEQIESRKKQITRHVPKLDKRVRTFTEGACDFIWFAQRIGPRAQIQTQPSEQFEAGSRVPLPDPMPLDARAIYAEMDKGFNPQPAQKTNTTETEKVAA